MKNTRIRKFTIDQIEMQFNLNIFNEMFNDKVKRTKKKVGEIEAELAEQVFVEKSTVHTWRNRKSGPSDLDKIKLIAEYFNCDYLDLMTEIGNEEDSMEQKEIVLTDREKESINKVYTSMLDHIRTATWFFDDINLDPSESLEKYVEITISEDTDIMDLLVDKANNVEYILQNEMVFLSKRTYDYLKKITSILHQISLVQYLGYNEDEDGKLEFDKVMEVNYKQRQRNFRSLRSQFFGLVKELLYG